MSVTPPIVFLYREGVMVPRSRALTDRWFGKGEVVTLERYEPRSQKTHDHQFAFLTSAWENLPEESLSDYPSPIHFRKKLLIEAGFCDVAKTVFSTPQDAVKAAALAMAIDDYCIATVEGRVLTRYTAKSQAKNTMKKDEFQRSKQAILELAAAKIGVSADALAKSTPDLSCGVGPKEE